MKNSLLLFISILLLFASCGKREKTELVNDENKTCVEILYFHGDMRCKSCIAMERGVAELLEEQFQDEVKDGKIVFKTIDITTSEGEQIADNYGVTWSSLYLNNWKNVKEERNDLTKDGFKYAVKDPDKLKGIIANKINGYLK